VERGYELPPPVERDVYAMDDRERKELGIQELSGSLNEAIAEMDKSELVRKALGDHIFAKFIENKKIG
jgi:glutamine synthetase